MYIDKGRPRRVDTANKRLSNSSSEQTNFETTIMEHMKCLKSAADSGENNELVVFLKTLTEMLAAENSSAESILKFVESVHLKKAV